ncbi:MAG: XRE family transcriptional regulator [Actinomycetota bacterium]
MVNSFDVETMVRTRLRALRHTLGLSLDEVAERTDLSASTISRIETGKRAISLDVLVPLAAALHVDLDVLFDAQEDDDVVIRPTPHRGMGHTTWLLSRPTSATVSLRVHLEPRKHKPEQRVHPGHDWFYVLSGRVRLYLGEREIVIESGEAAEFATMTPHALAAEGGPAQVVMQFSRDGQRAHREAVDAGAA